jgi:hypothetical protein
MLRFMAKEFFNFKGRLYAQNIILIKHVHTRYQFHKTVFFSVIDFVEK